MSFAGAQEYILNSARAVTPSRGFSMSFNRPYASRATSMCQHLIVR
jgi:hypothetical protein